jgi:hypothetical protein
MPGTAANGNSVNQMTNEIGSGGNAGSGFDPAKMIASETFDVEIFQKLGDGGTESIVKLRDCRFTRKGGAITKRGVLTEQFSFNAVLLDNDSTSTLAVGNSGDIDLGA